MNFPSAAPAPLHDAFSSKGAYDYTAQVAGFGERMPGSPGHQKTQDLIQQVLKKNGAQIEADDFTAKTPRGPIAVHNIIGKFNVTADPKQPIFILAGHYDTLFKPDSSAPTTAPRAPRFCCRSPTRWHTRKPKCRSG